MPARYRGGTGEGATPGGPFFEAVNAENALSALRAELDAALATDTDAETTARERLAAAEADIAAVDTTIETYQRERTRRADLTPEQREHEAATRRKAAPARTQNDATRSRPRTRPPT
ncbi:hypothetical protein R3Q06_33750 [Rhodococcus erythropolis]|uniref:hypothetical protein n=1 Tax=Rhodococcus erythropolis TaxID=1833 RepID=UPI00294A58F1|nr:hypothetical protein [Rhodococcus erythropolis]MDV6278393.1 hypothetical protein [Rhodococcus erythropolis]